MFYARRTTTQIPPDRLDVAKKVIETEVIPAAQKISGFIGGYWLADTDTGRAIGFTFFDTKESLEESAAVAERIRSEAVGSIGANVLSVDHFEVVAKTGDKIHSDAAFARVVEFSHEPSKIDSVTSRINESVIPAARQLAGFLGGFWVADRATGKGAGVTLYDTKKNLEESLQTVNRIRQESADATGASVGEPSHFEIIARATK